MNAAGPVRLPLIVDSGQMALLVNVAKFALEPEMLPGFHAWLLVAGNLPDGIPPADQIPAELAGAVASLGDLMCAFYTAAQKGGLLQSDVRIQMTGGT